MDRLGPLARSAGHELIHLDRVGSTNAEALRRAETGVSGPLWVTAREQTGGRGRRGRAWQSPDGNLHASLLVTHLKSDEAALLGLLASVALADAIDMLIPALGPSLRLKWPNDVLVHGSKLAGILVEAESVGNLTAAAIGIGVNCRHKPTGLPYAAACLADFDAEIEVAALFESLSDQMAEHLLAGLRGDALAVLRGRWLARAAGLGRPIAVRLPDRTLEGTFETLDAEGRLILRNGNDRRVISYGEVFFGRPPPAFVADR